VNLFYYGTLKSLRNIGNTAKTSLHAFCTSKKHMTGFLEKNFGGFCWNIELMVSSCLSLSLFTAKQNSVLC